MYGKSTSIFGITFLLGLGYRVQLELYEDVDYAHEGSDRGSVFRGVIMCAGACVSFYHRTPKSITLWSIEAGCVPMVTGFPETIFMRHLRSFFFAFCDVGCTKVKEDNQGATH